MDTLHILAHYLDRGPGKLVSTFRKGLNNLGIREVPFDKTDYIAALQWGDGPYHKIQKYSKKHALIGPNIWEAPSEKPDVARYFNDFIVPSEWVKQKHLCEDLLQDKNIHVWSGGIETDIWVPSTTKKDIDCLLYFKNRDNEEYQRVIEILRNLKLSGISNATVFEYGKYREDEFHNAVSRSKMAVLCTNTESQGYAYMQILSAGVPCVVFNKSTLVSRDGSTSWPATSVPYFDSRCGIIQDEINKMAFEQFFDLSSQFSPRDYILENHTIEISTSNYLRLLKNSTVLQ